MMRTARQGTLDGLCGLYAVINSLDLVGVAPGRGSKLHEKLFYQLVYGLGAVTLLQAMQDGVTAFELVNTTTLAFDWLEATYGVKLEISQPLLSSRIRSPQSFLRTLDGYLAKPETAVIISYTKPYTAHWTVVREISRTQMTLRDSSRGNYLELAEFRDSDSKCCFQIADTLLIKRVS
jgi:hypothetical protein